MHKHLTIALLVLLVIVPLAKADITLTFEGLKNQEAILDFYNGGFGGAGSGPGPNYGITFGSSALAIIASNSPGGTGNFSNSPSGHTIAFFLSGIGDVMNVAAGFDTGFSFYYSAPVYPGSVTVYDDLNATGNVLANLNLPLTPNGGGSCTAAYCPWIPIGVAFSGVAKSVNFSGTANYIGFDNITLGNKVPTGVPEPGAIALFATVLSGVALLRRRKARA